MPDRLRRPPHDRLLLSKPVAAFITALFLITGCTKAGPAGDPQSALIAIDQCHRVTLIDSATQQKIIGAEDLAVDHQNGLLFISAYDRRAVEKKASRHTSTSIPAGGLYRVSLEDLLAPEKPTLIVQSLIRADNITGGLRPHGISYDQQSGELVFINRSYTRKGKKWQMTARLERVGADGAAILSPPGQAPCAANDVTISGEHALISFDHAACNWRGTLEDIFNLRKSGLIDARSAKPLFTKARHANGIVTTATGAIALAATRDQAVHIFSVTPTGGAATGAAHGLTHRETIKLPGGPDNLTLAFDGAIIAAVHPSLMRMGAHRKWGWGRAPSRIVRIDPDTRAVTTLLDHRSGKLFSAATVGVETKTALILGSVTDAGLLVCRKNQHRKNH